MTYALLSGVVAAAISFALGGPLVSYLRARKIGKAIAAESPDTHNIKAGTPTFGGLLFAGVAAALGLAVAVPKDRDVLLPVAAVIVMGAVGFYDDLGTLVDRVKRDAHSRAGMILKALAYAIFGGVAAALLYGPLDAPRMLVPHFGAYDIGPLYIAVVIFIIVATTSAVDVSDGLDTLCGGMSAIAFTAFGAIALRQGQDGVATFCFVMVGALMGFLWFNAYPARLFMGDVGSGPLGGALAIVALQTGWWLLIPVIGVMFVAEIAADVVQIGYFRLSGGKRIFRRAPLHCHFELMDIPETRITAAFLLVTAAGALAGVALSALD